MQSQEQDQKPDDMEQTGQGQGTSASANTPDQPAGNIPSGIGGTDLSGEDSADQTDSLPSDGPLSQEGGNDGEGLTNIETDDDEFEIRD